MAGRANLNTLSWRRRRRLEVVQMDNIRGQYHGHPNGEVDMIVPESANVKFYGMGRGLIVYAPDSEPYPAVTGGKAIVLYLLPGGNIDFRNNFPGKPVT